MERIYFDNGSTSFPKAPGVSDAVRALLDNGAFNINRGGYEEAYAISGQVLETRQMLCSLFGFHKFKNVVFTPSITYSLNYLIKGFLKPGDHVITSSMEHNAVMRPLVQMEKQGVAFDAVPCAADGTLDPALVEKCIRPNTKAVVLTAASNVCGTFLPIAEVGRICHDHGIAFIVDSAQKAGTFPISMEECGIDALCFTGHKSLLGPQGIGGMLLSDRMAKETTPLIAGGTGSASHLEEMPSFMPDRFEAGTMNLPGIIGLRAALLYHQTQEPGAIAQKELDLAMRFREGVLELPGARPVGLSGREGRAAIVSVDFKNDDNARIAFELEQGYGVMTRVGLHCAPRAHQTLGTYPEGTVRFSFGHGNTEAEVDYCLDALRRICAGK
ncbi:MAG: aminotransferase class V-fold PLP-dependent enzyme [Clostridia bacterium]|nr:aminotransferase class V-fold PLP-dependent enzyme [Clostridia bacterium]